jgi:N-acetylglucosaminyldiphosphoundecaprenol N-acetyl-beta-D-mannosaminyltransferase
LHPRQAGVTTIEPDRAASVAAADQAPHRVSLLGLPLDRVSEDEVIDKVLDGVKSGRGGWICPVNLDVLRKVTRDRALRELISDADLLVADGMPLVWASQIQGDPLPERVAGSSLVLTLPAAAVGTNTSFFLLGGDPGVAESAAQRLVGDHAGLHLVGTLCPPVGFQEDPEELARIEHAIDDAKPDVVFVALGFPKQDQLISRLRATRPAMWFLSCGISLSFVSGDVRRAPVWIQRLGLEWLHRLAQEPRRLARRYLVEGFPFMARLVLSAVRNRSRAQDVDAR